VCFNIIYELIPITNHLTQLACLEPLLGFIIHVHSGSSSPKGLIYVEFHEELKALLSPEAWIRASKARKGVAA
jgi:hypothetical protein